PSNCGASNGTAFVNVTGTGPFTYAWSAGSTNANQNGLFAGTYTVNVSGAGGCSAAASVTVGTGAAHGNINMNVTNVACYGSYSGAITTTVTGGGAPYSYAWSNGATTSGISSLPPGTYYVTVTTSGGCISSDSATITTPATGLSYSMSASNVTCSGSATGSATVNVTGGTGPYNYSWNTSPVQTTATATNVPAGNVTVTVTDNNGCTISGTTTISEPATLSANAMVVSNVTCNGFANGQTTVGASGGSGPYTYSWNTTPVQNTQTASGLAPGNYTATVTDANGCALTSTVSVSEPSPLAFTSAVFPVSCNGECDGQAMMIPSGGSPTYTYQWLPSGGTSAGASGLCPGTYTGVITDANGCTVSTTLAVTQPSVITLTASGSTTICAGQNTSISASASGGTGTYTYNWSTGATGSTQIVSPSAPATYIVSVTDANGCSGVYASVDINVTSLTAANLTVMGSTAICYGSTAAVSSSVSGNTGAVTVNWSHGLGTGNGPFTVTPASTTTYTVTVTDGCGVSVTGTIPVTVNPLPVIDLSPQSAVACNEVTMNFMDNSTTNSGAGYSWAFGDGGSSAHVSPSHTYTSSGNYVIHVTVTSSFGCVNTASTSANVIVNAGTHAQFTTEAMDGTVISPTYKFISSSTNAAYHHWYFGDGGMSTLVNPTHTYPDKGEYLVKLVTTTAEGCVDSVSIPLEIRPVFTLYIPNAFTPDGNGNNDYFIPKGAEINEFSMMIFDRWGEMIFQSNDLSKGWDGKANNGSNIAQQGVYVYKISVRDFEQRYHAYTGHVTLLPNE
nr:PKD domain-containing protein [Bacteroidota bacterium]